MLAVSNTPNGPALVAIRDVPEPTPARNEFVLAVKAFSLNRGELRSLRNTEEGWIPGQDVSGVVVAPAADGSGPKAGQRVLAMIDEFGWAERTAVPVHRATLLPDNVSFADASTLPVAGLTALRTLRYGGSLLGRRVLITGAAGGVGHLAVQMAARSGAHVTAVVGRAERGAHLKELGAEAVVEGIEQAQGLFWLVLESAGGASLAGAIRHVEPGGIVVIFGNSSAEPTSISFADFREHPNARIQSFFSFSSEPEERFAPDLALLVSLVATGALKPHYSTERSWRDLAQTMLDLRDRRVTGKAVFRVEA